MIFDHMLRGHLVVEEIESAVLADNPLGDPVLRRVPIYLPPGYHRREQELPVVYALKGLFGSAESWLSFGAFGENLFQVADRLIAEGAPPFVVACPDCFTRYGGSQYLNSTATGRYADHVIQEVLPVLEEKYTLRSDAGGRAVAGRSSGGFGALRLAADFPGVFAHAASSAGDMYFRLTVMAELARFPQLLEKTGGLDAFLEGLKDLRSLDSSSATLLNVIALSACYSPDPSSPRGFRLPIDPRSGELREEVLARWLEQDPVTRIAERREALKALQTHYLEAGDRDEYHAELGMRRYAAVCREEGVPLRQELFAGGHFGGSARWEVMLKVLVEGFQASASSPRKASM